MRAGSPGGRPRLAGQAHGCRDAGPRRATTSWCAALRDLALAPDMWPQLAAWPHSSRGWPAGVGNVGHFNEGSHNLGSYNTGSRNVGDKSMCSLCVGHGLSGFGLLGAPAVFLPASAAEPTKEEL